MEAKSAPTIEAQLALNRYAPLSGERMPDQAPHSSAKPARALSYA
jgi:hypothetical protein